MRKNRGFRMLCLMITLVLLLQCLPVGAIAQVNDAFCLVVEAGGRLVIAPEYISYEPGQTIRQALLASGHVFTGMDDSSGMITAIDGVSGNYTRSDEKGGYALDVPACDIQFFRFSETENSTPSEALTLLMREMADYRMESADVQAAAKEAYEKATESFVGASDEEAQNMTQAIADAISAYEASQSGTAYCVTFSDGTGNYASNNYNGVTVVATNVYGKHYTDDGDGVLQLPAGTYDFVIAWDIYHIEGTVDVTSDHQVTAAVPAGDWLVEDTFAISGSYGEYFDSAVFPVTKQEAHRFLAVVPDSFTGNVYPYVQYDANLLTAVPTLKAVYTDAEGTDTQCDLVFGSKQTGATQVLKQGALGNTLTLRLGVVDGNGFVLSQDYTVELARNPSLKSISMKDQDGAAQASTEPFSAAATDYIYKVVDTVAAVTVDPVPFSADYTVTVNGTGVQDAGVTVSLNTDESGNPIDTPITILVQYGDFQSTYNLMVCPGEGKKITFVTTASNVDLIVVNSNGEALPYTKYKGTDTYNRYIYTLVPGETYSYQATKDTYYHAQASFTMEQNADSTITVDVKAEDLLSDLALGTQSTANKKNTIPLDSAFISSDHHYQTFISDSSATVSLWAALKDGVQADLSAVYDQISFSSVYDGVSRTVELTSGNTKGVVLLRVLIARNPYGNEITVRVTQREGGITYYQDYVVEIDRQLSLQDLTAHCNGNAVLLLREDTQVDGYVAGVTGYVLNVPAAATELILQPQSFAASSNNLRYGDEATGYQITVNAQTVTQDKVVVPLSGQQETEEVTLTLTNEHCPELKTEYSLTVQKDAPIFAEVSMEPAQGLLAVYETQSGNRIWPENGRYMFSEGYTYTYMLTASGYVGQSGTMEVTRNEDNDLVFVMDDQTIPVQTGEDGVSGSVKIQAVLAKAPENTQLDPAITSQWSDFRGTATNNAVTNDKIPFSADEGTLFWAKKLGSGYGSEAVGCPIIVNGDLITYSGNTIYRVDAVSGEVLATGTMDHNSSYSITTPTYYESMIFVALSEGTVQAFNAKTLESLWIYRDPLGGQPNSPITVRDGYLYTGFWVGETSNANYVCLTVTDEDPAVGMEEKSASWYYTQRGGFYWAGAYVGEDYLLVGTDDGHNGYTSQSSQLLLLDSRTGYLMDSWNGLDADIRSTVCYDAATDAYYFTSKGGQFYSVQICPDGDGWKFTNQWSVELGNGTSVTAMSTSTPVVYNGRAYVGVAGIGQFSDYSGHNISVIDLNKRSIVYRVQTQGYPQTSGLLTTAYEEESGYVYVYFFDNATPGKLRVLRDKAGQTAADYVTAEEDISTPYVLFTPYGDHAQYAICSPITDDYGTVYFKNDSAHLMAFGSRIERIELTQAPTKTVYYAGESFDPAGMVVTATYANGMTRDVTQYVTFSDTALALGESAVTITFPYVMYHNQDEGSGVTTGGITTTQPTVLVQIQVKEPGEAALGDVNMDGRIDIQDANLIASSYNQILVLTAAQLVAADVNGDGAVDISDKNLVSNYYNEQIESFPAEEKTK